ncbi:reverse transcriptase domain-containing protein [Cupriavidus basilensis]
MKGCFDHISHEWLERNVPMDKAIPAQVAESWRGISGPVSGNRGRNAAGGIISPTLANMALNGLEEQLRRHLAAKFKTAPARKLKVNVVRYADDFVITGTSPEVLEQDVRPWVEQFLATRGLTLSMEKTRIVNIAKGFDFLGWNFRKYSGKLLIKPSKKNVRAFYRKVKEVLSGHKTVRQSELIRVLNPVLRGWAKYHSPRSSQSDVHSRGA